MKLPILNLVVLSLVLASAAGATSGAPAVPAVVGAEKEYNFREPPLNSMGVKSLTELRGKPIVIDFWGRN